MERKRHGHCAFPTCNSMPTSIITKWVQHQPKNPPPQKHKTCSLIAPLHLLYCFVHPISLLTSLHLIFPHQISRTSNSLLTYLFDPDPRTRSSLPIDRSTFTSVVTSTTQGPPLRVCDPLQHVEATTAATTISPIMDSSQYYYNHHHHHSHRHHHKSLSQQQSSTSLSSTNRGTPPLHTHLPSSSSMPLRTANSTPMSSPGLFSPSASRQNLVTSVSENNTPPNYAQSPLLHPLQMHKVRE